MIWITGYVVLGLAFMVAVDVKQPEVGSWMKIGSAFIWPFITLVLLFARIME